MNLLPRKVGFLVAIFLVLVAAPVVAQSGTGWKAASGGSARHDGPANGQAPVGALASKGQPQPAGEITPVQGAPTALPTTAPGITRAQVSKGSGALPQDKGQVWREYDIRPYTQRVTTTARPEQAIVDWILRETGYEAWHSDPCGVLSANRDVLRVYHTPEMQAVVGGIFCPVL